MLGVSQVFFADKHTSSTARACFVLLSAALLVASFPPISAGVVCAWVAFVPLFVALRGLTPLQAALVGGAWALLANAGIFEWMLQAAGFRWYHFIALDAVYSALPALWCALVVRIELGRVRGLSLAAALWVLVEFARTHAGFLALPLATIAHTQIDNVAVTQIAAVFGEPAVTFVVLLANLILYRLLLRTGNRPLTGAAVSVVLAVAVGASVVLVDDGSVTSVRSIAALDTHYSPRGPHILSNAARMRTTLAFMERTAPGDAMLAILPESAFVNPHRSEIEQLRAFADSRNIAVVAGVAQAAKFEQGVPRAAGSPPDRRVSNAAWIILPQNAQPARYEKAVRMPFSEYLPLSAWVHWPRWLVGFPPEVIAGPGPQTFSVRGDTKVGLMICWETLIAAHARALASEGATVLVVIANDGWFGSEGAAGLQGLAARMRAVETRRPLVLAANEGVSMLVDRFGRVVARAAGQASAEWVRGDVGISSMETPYVRWGDVFVILCGGLVVASAAGRWFQMRGRSAPREHPGSHGAFSAQPGISGSTSRAR